MLDRAARWGILPSYYGWQGNLVETTRATSEAILAAMGATQEDQEIKPPRVRRPKLSSEPCAAPPERTWGWAIQLYALRSRDSWGIGDLGDLRRFARWAKKGGASVILLKPLGAAKATLPYEPSPYYASSRRFRNVLYLRIEDVEGAEKVQQELQPQREQALKLNQQRLIDYDQVFQLKTNALEAIFQAAPEPQGLTAYVRKQGQALRDFATFNAVAEERGRAWRTMPRRHPKRGDPCGRHPPRPRDGALPSFLDPRRHDRRRGRLRSLSRRHVACALGQRKPARSRVRRRRRPRPRAAGGAQAPATAGVALVSPAVVRRLRAQALASRRGRRGRHSCPAHRGRHLDPRRARAPPPPPAREAGHDDAASRRHRAG